MSGTLALASTIASHSREALSALVQNRRIAAPAQVLDPIDLAAELLKADSIGRALSSLTRTQIADLVAVEGHVTPNSVEALLALGLVAHDTTTGATTALPEVSATLTAAFDARGLMREDFDPEVAPETHDDGVVDDTPDTSGWFAPALTTTAQCAWVLREFDRAPAKINRGGTIASTWLKATEERVHVPRIDQLLPLLRAAGLLAAKGAETTVAAHEWLRAGHEERWIRIARAAIDTAPKQLINMITSRALTSRHSFDGPDGVAALVVQEYPLIEDATRASVVRTVEVWQRLGIVFQGALPPSGRALIDGTTPDFEFPGAASGIYIQPDLSVVVPGPLAPLDETELSAVAIPEQIGVASTLRITDASLGEALDRGVEADEIRGALERLSLTGIPQPLSYLITSISERAGTVVVSEHHGDAGRTRIDVARPDLRAMIQVDRSLAHLQLHELGAPDAFAPDRTHPASGETAPLYSRLRPDHVLAALIDARYPARAHSSLGEAVDPHRHFPLNSVPSGTTVATTDPDPYELLIDRVLASAADGPGDISRQITLAIRDRRAVQVTVEIRGDRRDFSLLPVSLSAGRMRALDEAAGVERTFPLEAITEVVAR